MNQSSGTLQRRTDISLTTALMSIQADPFQHIGVSAAGRPAIGSLWAEDEPPI